MKRIAFAAALAACTHPPAPAPAQLGNDGGKPAIDPLAPRPAAGPYPSLAAWCDARLAKERAALAAEDDPELYQERMGELACHPDEPAIAAGTTRGHGGSWRELRIVAVDIAGGAVPGYRMCGLAMETRAGWYVGEDLARCKAILGDEHEIVGGEVVLLEPADNRVRLVLGEDEDLAGERRRHDYLVICGLGDSGAASCTPPILIEDPGIDRDDDTLLHWTLSNDTLSLDGSTQTWQDEGPERRAVHERHALRFP